MRPVVRPLLNGSFTFLKSPETVENTAFHALPASHAPPLLNALKRPP